MATDENVWRTQSFRQRVIEKIDEAVQSSGMPIIRNTIDMENHVFQTAKTMEEYLRFVARLILRVRELNFKKAGATSLGTAGSGNQGMPDPIGALQMLARQGTGNNQMMNISGPGPNPQEIIPQQPANTAINLLPSLNQRCGQPMTMQSMQNKVPGIGMMSAQTSSPMSYMSPTQTMQNNLMFTQMNPMAQGNMPQQINQVVLNQMGPITTGQMQQNMQAQMQNQLSDQINNQFGLLYISDLQTSMSQQMNLIAPGQLDPDQMQQQLNHMQRKPDKMINTGYPSPRNVATNQFLGQSPFLSAPSLAGLDALSRLLSYNTLYEYINRFVHGKEHETLKYMCIVIRW
nr:mediator of RNA polymerase II transcription subunit 15-like isoform X2 [Nomia melanderi]XP_031850414.1 mediator of RNA polymerase II transcription subunit 15-like isoform X2 [Nomia melanderi]XP_031850415.1 mediator of RNA polymerase II transcription subunit 15-like isoform X2 [Nomia melanderi]XP_031850416.1 mediator of RNA polymerase II transcription subunit 15-like isoform X2 [Nomia melanderi]XP_031850417.1 mediator of RNA polymerase II transcription subunit 15-like isoform X2 [Nomia meland